MSLEYMKYDCSHCGTIFKSLDSPYGEFVLISEAGELAFMRAYDDLVFNEFRKLIRENKLVSELDDLSRSDLLHNIFGIACDPAPDGSLYQISRKPMCPNCNTSEYSCCWGPTHEFVELSDLNIPIISHNHWNKLTNQQKKDLIEEAINNQNMSQYAKKQSTFAIVRFYQSIFRIIGKLLHLH